jgi:hypothetical protein
MRPRLSELREALDAATGRGQLEERDGTTADAANVTLAGPGRGQRA